MGYGLAIGLVRRFRGTLVLIKIVFITFNVIKIFYPSFYCVEWTYEWPILPLKI